MDESTIQGAERPETIPEDDDPDDVEGHNLLPDPELGREMARAREADIERRLKVHEAQAEARQSPDPGTPKKK